MSSRLTKQVVERLTISPRIEIGGITPSTCAYTLANLISTSKEKIVFVCATQELAESIFDDVKSFLSFLDDSAHPNVVDYFPGWEHSPYLGLNPSIKGTFQRMKTLWKVLNNESRLVITSLQALSQRCTAKELITDRAIKLTVGDFISREELRNKLFQAGYTERDPVEDPGTFCFRGGLLDIFSPFYDEPQRIDFFGDEIEKIKCFNQETQRSKEKELKEATIIPVSDWPFTDEILATGKSNIKKFCDEHGIPKQVRDEYFSKLDDRIKDPGLDYLLPFFINGPGPLLFDFCPDWKFAIYDSLGIETSYDHFAKNLDNGFKHALLEERIVCSRNDLFLTANTLNDFVKNKVSLQFDEISLGIPETIEEKKAALENPDEHAEDKKLQLKVYRNNDINLSKDGSLDALLEKIKLWEESSYQRVIVASTPSQAERVQFLLSQKGVNVEVVDQVVPHEIEKTLVVTGSISAGFRLPKDQIAVLTDSEIFGQKKVQKKKKKPALNVDAASFISSIEDLNPGENIVHHVHGIGKYHGLQNLNIDGVSQDFLALEYAGNDKLYLPIYRLDHVQRYVGSSGSATLDKLGSTNFEKTKKKVKSALEDIAHKLLELYATRADRPGHSFAPVNEDYQKFEAEFPYAETPDQLKAIEDINQDMDSDQILDRLICGDVGYGKTEVAMRAAYRTINEGKQVAVLVPTTVLALQHERTFRDRFKNSPANIGVLSRFKSPTENKKLLERVKKGEIDIVIGTHRLLSRDVGFSDLGLMIIDEEQRFGVEHKERLKRLKVNTDVLTLTATPIPRTLNMSLMGLRDISVINTPPVDRLSVRTYVARFNEEVIRRAIRQEVERGGQVFFIHNRVQSINEMADRLQQIVPEVKVIIAHGQLDDKVLEQKMLSFYNKEASVLLCSTIIESGLDIPSANTMIINRADMFGLSQLYQLRGRVGRSQNRAYCYLLLPEAGAVTEEAKQRIDVIQRFAELGAGYKVATHDLEIRGAGNLLGKSQSGHISSVGYELYMELLDETIREIKGQPQKETLDPEIKIPVPALLPEDYVPDVHQRLGLYKKLSGAENPDKLHELELELQDRFGKIPDETKNLVWLIRIKQLLQEYQIPSLTAGKKRTAIDAGSKSKISAPKMMQLVQKSPNLYTVTPDSKIVLKIPFESAQKLFTDVRNLLSSVADQ